MWRQEGGLQWSEWLARCNYITLQRTALLLNDNADLRAANKEERQERTRSTSRSLTKRAFQSKRAYS
jgi:hypothetical protein